MERLLEQSLVNAGVVKPVFSLEDVGINDTNTVPLVITNELHSLLKEYFSDRAGYYMLMPTKLIIAMIREHKINREKLEESIDKIIDDKVVATQIVDMFYYATKTAYSTNLSIIGTMCAKGNALLVSIKDIISLLYILIIQMFPYEVIETFRSADDKDNFIHTWLYNYGIRAGNADNNDNEAIFDNTMQYFGVLDNLPVEIKKNIISSIWDCIIDIINYRYGNYEFLKEVK